MLCYSRLMYVEFTVSQTMKHFLACHQHAFEAFGGVPGSVMVDNLKSAVLKRTSGEAPVFNPRYADFARHTGFRIVPCNVGKGNEKAGWKTLWAMSKRTSSPVSTSPISACSRPPSSIGSTPSPMSESTAKPENPR
jgi:transposase